MRISLLWIVIILLSFNARASLVSYQVEGANLVYDPSFGSNGLTWVSDVALFKTMYDGNPGIVQEIIDSVQAVDGHTLEQGDFHHRGNLSWWGGMAFAEWINYAGSSDWRLYSEIGADGSPPCGTCYKSEMAHLIFGVAGLSTTDALTDSPVISTLFINIEPHPDGDNFWSITPRSDNPALIGHGFRTLPGQMGPISTLKSNHGRIWLVQEGRVGAVPIPSTVLMLLSGLAGIVASRRAGFIRAHFQS